MGVAARLLAPLASGVESNDILGVGVASSPESGESRIVKSSQEARGAERVSPGVFLPITSVLSPL